MSGAAYIDTRRIKCNPPRGWPGPPSEAMIRLLAKHPPEISLESQLESLSLSNTTDDSADYPFLLSSPRIDSFTHQQLKLFPQRLIEKHEMVDSLERFTLRAIEDEKRNGSFGERAWWEEAVRTMKRGGMSAENIEIWLKHIESARIASSPVDEEDVIGEVFQGMIEYWNEESKIIMRRDNCFDFEGNTELDFQGANPLRQPTLLLSLVPVIGQRPFGMENIMGGSLAMKGIYQLIATDGEVAIMDRHSHAHQNIRGDTTDPIYGRFSTCDPEMVELQNEITDFILEWRACALPASRNVTFGRENEAFMTAWLANRKKDIPPTKSVPRFDRFETDKGKPLIPQDSELHFWTTETEVVDRIMLNIERAMPRETILISKVKTLLTARIGESHSFSYTPLPHPSAPSYAHADYRKAVQLDFVLNALVMELGLVVPISARRFYGAMLPGATG